METMEFLLVLFFINLTIPALLVFVLHWFPWPFFIRRKLHRIEAYTLGTLAYAVPASGTSIYAIDVIDASVVLAFFWMALVAAGVATASAWIFDRWMAQYHRMQDRIDQAEITNGATSYESPE